jgi:hypothetical protein
MSIGNMKAVTQDNDTWQPLSLATRRLLVNLGKQQDGDRSVEPNAEPSDEQKRSDEERYLTQRLRDIERFERMVRGAIAPRRKRN